MLLRLARHSAWLLPARLGSYGAMAVFTIAAARSLGESGFGEYSFMAALIATGNMITTFGTDMLLIREIAAGRPLGRLAGALRLQLLLSLLFAAGTWLAAPHLGFLSASGGLALRLYSLSLLPLAFFTVFTTALRGKEQMGAYAATNAALAVSHLLAGIVQFLRGGDLVLLAGMLLAAQAASALLAGLLCIRAIPGFASEFWPALRRRVPEAALLSLARASAPLALLAGLGAVYQRLALALLPGLAGLSEAGIFAAAFRLVEAARLGHVAVLTAVYPMLAQRRESGPGWLRPFRPVWLLLLGSAALASLALFLLAEPLVGWLFGAGYAPAAAVVRVLAWAIPPYIANTSLSLVLLANEDEPALVRAYSASLLALAALTLWWGRAAGPGGAAWAVLYAEYFQCGILLFQALRTLRSAPAL